MAYVNSVHNFCVPVVVSSLLLVGFRMIFMYSIGYLPAYTKESEDGLLKMLTNLSMEPPTYEQNTTKQNVFPSVLDSWY